MEFKESVIRAMPETGGVKQLGQTRYKVRAK
jgi:hypothetical protein